MPKKPLIGDRERSAIAQAFNLNRKGKAELIRQVASRICGRELGLSTVQRELAALRKKHPRGSTNPLDNQWSLGSLREYPIPVEAFPLLLFVQETFRDNLPEDTIEFAKRRGDPIPFLTIRLAVWMARIMTVPSLDDRGANTPSPTLLVPASARKTPSENLNKWPQRIDDIVSIAMWYSNYEMGCELAGISPINTVMFDATLREEMKTKIMAYQQPIYERHAITNFDDPATQDRWVDDVGPRGIVVEGRKRNARSHTKKS